MSVWRAVSREGGRREEGAGGEGEGAAPTCRKYRRVTESLVRVVSGLRHMWQVTYSTAGARVSAELDKRDEQSVRAATY